LPAMISITLRRGSLRMKSPQEDAAVLDGGDTSRFDPEDACGYNPDVPTVDVATQAPEQCGRLATLITRSVWIVTTPG
jgi:hypothetical protein